MPETSVILRPFFIVMNSAFTFINTRILPLISSTAQLKELPVIWLLNRVHTIVEERQKNPISRVDLLQLMLQAITTEPIDVSKTICIRRVSREERLCGNIRDSNDLYIEKAR